MGNRVKSSKLVYFLVFSVSSSSIVGCGYHPFRADKKYYKYQPTLLDRVWARSMVMTKDDNIEKSVEKIRDFIKPGKEGEVKKALRELVDSENKEKKKDELIKACTDKIKIHIQTVNLKPEDQIIEENIKPVLNDLIKYEEKEYAVNGMKFKVKDNSIEFTGLGVSVPLKDVKVTDADVIGFSSDIQKALRARMDFGRRVRLGSGTVQILAAAAGATLGLITKDVTTAAALAAVSAVIPELQNIFQARDRVGAYKDGLALLQDAEARYYQKMTQNGAITTISAEKLTPEGSQLLVETAACLKLVDKALFQTIPTIEDLKAATGMLEKLGEIKVVPTRLSISVGGTHTVHVINSKAITYASDDIRVVTVDNISDFERGTDRIVIKGVGPGSSTVTVFNVLGRSGNFAVDVVIPKPTVETGTATSMTANSVTLHGTVTANSDASTNAWFDYGTQSGNYSRKKDAQPGTITGTGDTPVTAEISDLKPATTYHYRIAVKNSADTAYGSENSFVTKISTPTVETGTATNTTANSATLHGMVTANGASTTAWFDYGTVSGAYGSQSDKIEVTDKEEKLINVEIKGLLLGATYYYRIAAENTLGKSEGSEESFKTKPIETVSPTPTVAP